VNGDDNGYDQMRAETEIERGGRVVRAEHDENELHEIGRQAVVGVRARAAAVKAQAKRK
jgi:hypothetical protein